MAKSHTISDFYEIYYVVHYHKILVEFAKDVMLQFWYE